MSFLVSIPAYVDYSLNVKIPREWLLLYRHLCLVLTKDVSRLIFPIWWKFFYCMYIHQQSLWITIAYRHVLKYDLNQRVLIAQCTFCGGIEYSIYNFGNIQWSKHFPLLDKEDLLLYKNHLHGMTEMLCFVKDRMPSIKLKKILFKELLFEYGTMPLQQSWFESLLLRWYNTKKAKGYFPQQLQNYMDGNNTLFIKINNKD